MENNTMILNGQKYRLIPVRADWEIRCVFPDEQPLCLLGHNGRTMMPNQQIFAVRLGNENFTVGDKIIEGKIEKFIYDKSCQYVYAKIENSNIYIDVDNLKKAA